MEQANNKWMIWLPALALASVPFGRAVEVFVLIMAIIGINDLLKNHNNLRHSSAFQLFTVIFLLFWVPGLCSTIDAVNTEKTMKTVALMPRFYFAGLFILSRISSKEHHLKLGLAIAAIAVFWAIDGWIQAYMGVDLFGLKTSSSTRISGIFGENPRLGLTIVPFFAISVFAVYQRFGLQLTIVLIFILSATILLSGDRAAWVSLLVAIAIIAFIFKDKILSLNKVHYLTIMLLMGLMLSGLSTVPRVQERLDQLMLAFDGDYESINKASSSRLPLWKTALNMFQDNPINGVGVRSFRYAYPDYAGVDDPFVNFSLPREKQLGQTHAHQVVLEFATETGVIGLLGYVSILIILLFKLWPLAYASQSLLSMGYLTSLTLAFFPFNTHHAIFSSHWGQIVWMLIALAISTMASECGKDKLRLRSRNA